MGAYPSNQLYTTTTPVEGVGMGCASSAVTPTGVCRAASVIAIATALYTSLMAFQATGLVRSAMMRVTIAAILVVLGGMLLIAGWKIRRLNGRATWVGLAVSVVIGLLGGVWFLTNLVFGVANLMPLIVMGAALLSAACCAATVKTAMQADRARTRLAEHGVSLGG